ncbi:hypothetical protein HGB13_04640 [bacterium]|nr:hypothetical protein [bacterium]
MNEYQSIISEINELNSLLASVPEEYVIDRMSLEARLDAAKEILGNLSVQYANHTAILTFRGRPVLGTHGIFADFASNATKCFSDAFVAVVAGLGNVLSDNGPLPNRARNQLMITGVALGSFGFELELPYRDPELFPEIEELRRAMTKIEALFRLTANGSDDEVAEIVEDMHPRAIRKVYEYLDLLVKSEAWCGFEFENHKFVYSDYEQIQYSCERLKADNIQESFEEFQGEFQGVLPNGRTFEFRVYDDDEIIRGKVGVLIEDPDVLNREWLHRIVRAQLHVVRFGVGRPRYSLLSLVDLYS